MKIAPEAPIPRKPKKKAAYIVPLIREETDSDSYDAEKLVKFKLRNSPADADSTLRETSILPFDTGTPEKFIEFKLKLAEIQIGLNNTTGSAQYQTARQLLHGDALAAFNVKATELSTQTVAHYAECISHLTQHVMPAKAAKIHNRYLRHSVRKPNDMTTKQFFSRVVEMVEMTTQIDSNATKLSDEAVKEILEFGVPYAWQAEMTRQMFDPLDKTVQELLHFFEAQEQAERDDPLLKKPTNHNDSSKKRDRNSDRKYRKSSSKHGRKTKTTINDDEPFCKLHGHVGHSTSECKAVAAFCKRRKTERADEDKKPKAKTNGFNKEHYALMKATAERAVKNYVEGKDEKKRKKHSEEQDALCAKLDGFQLQLSDGELASSDESDSTASV